ncbi:MAG: chromate transporter [Eubacteriales bacterium]
MSKEKKFSFEKNIMLDLYFTFFILGATTFGGGYAMLPTLQRTIVDKKGWAKEGELADYFAIGQCTPGIIAVNAATFIGKKYKGTLGGIVATLGLVTPCVFVITVIGSFFSGVNENPLFDHGFNGVKACVAVLVGGAAWKILKEALVDKTTGGIFYAVFSLMVLGHLYPDIHPMIEFFTSPITLVICSGALGYVLYQKKEKEEKKKGESE